VPDELAITVAVSCCGNRLSAPSAGGVLKRPKAPWELRLKRRLLTRNGVATKGSFHVTTG
jgi:hypothetical protein